MSSPEIIKSIFTIAKSLLDLEKGKGMALTQALIKQKVNAAAKLLGQTNIDVNLVAGELERYFQIVIGSARAIDGHDRPKPWLPEAKSKIEWKFWNRYFKKLQLDDGWAEMPLLRMGETTDMVLERIENPKREGRWDHRGMVVGHVQSGKTSHYTGLICKAADAGYKVIIVLAGLHNSLRSQTQIRLEEGFLGYDMDSRMQKKEIVPIGVGLFELLRVDSITTRAEKGDFKSAVARNFAINPGGNPLLFVVKKNATVLDNLFNWIEFAKQGKSVISDVPLLVIDDEADHGSVDTNEQTFNDDGTPDPDHNPTVLNGHIRKILRSFQQCAYVGYTATPFANIFIHDKGRTENLGDDLFPRSFIISLPTPSNHIGPARIFGLKREDGIEEDGMPIIRSILDQVDVKFRNNNKSKKNSKDKDRKRNEKITGWMPEKHNKLHNPLCEGKEELPASLREAIRAFLLTCAARIVRGQTKICLGQVELGDINLSI